MRRAIAGAAIGVLLAAAAGPLAAQTSRADPTDVQAWYGAGVKLDLPRRWEASLQYRARMVGDARSYRGSYLTGEVGRGLGKRVQLFTGYRLALVDDGTYHRVAVGGEYEHRLGRTTLSLREIVQVQRQRFDDDEQGDSDAFARTRARIEHALGERLDVYASVEPFLPIGGGGEGRYAVDNWRNTLGLQFEYRKGRRVDLFYIYRPDYARSYNRTFHVVGADLDFTVKPFARRR